MYFFIYLLDLSFLCCSSSLIHLSGNQCSQWRNSRLFVDCWPLFLTSFMACCYLTTPWPGVFSVHCAAPSPNPPLEFLETLRWGHYSISAWSKQSYLLLGGKVPFGFYLAGRWKQILSLLLLRPRHLAPPPSICANCSLPDCMFWTVRPSHCFILKIWKKNATEMCQTLTSTAGVGKLRPASHIRPIRLYNPARQRLHVHLHVVYVAVFVSE